MKDDSLLDRYLSYVDQRARPSATRDRFVAQRFFQWMASRRLSLSEATPRLVYKHLLWWKSRVRDPYRPFHGLQRFFQWLVQEKILAQNPIQGLSCAWIGRPGGFPAYTGSLQTFFRWPGFMLKYRRMMFWTDLEHYVDELRQRFYPKSYRGRVLEHCYGFHQYLRRRGLWHLTDITPEHLNAYGRCWLKARRLNTAHVQRSLGMIEHFLDFAFRRRGRLFRPPKPIPRSASLPDRLLQRYLDFCRLHTGHKAITARLHESELRSLGQFLDARGRRTLQQACLKDFEDYSVWRSKVHRAPMKTVGILRSFLRFLYLQGIVSNNLARHLQNPCRFQANTRPKYLPWATVERLLKAIDRRNLTGQRDYALLTLLAYHGLRPREAARLRLDDIHWQNDSFLLRERKNGDTTPMPLDPRARQALQDYLAVRPSSSIPEIFLTCRAPLKALGRAVIDVVQRRTRRHLGRLLPHQGAYVLRHSFAKALLDQGATLPEIGAVLGHRSAQGTQAYLRIATEDMRDVADNYATLLLESQPPCANS